MSENTDLMMKMQLLASARQMLTDEYNQTHRDEYTVWAEQQKNAWQQPIVSVPYPPFFVNSSLTAFQPSARFPSEAEVVARALILYNQSQCTTQVPSVLEQQSSIIVNNIPDDPIVTEPIIQEPVVEEIVTPLHEDSTSIQEIKNIYKDIDITFKDPVSIAGEVALLPMPAEQLADASINAEKILPSVLRKIEELKLLWASKK